MPNLASGALTSDFVCFDTSNGELTYQTSNCTVSLRELKDHITPYTGGLSDALALQPVTFVLRNEPAMGEELGLIAQDAEAVNKDLAVYDEKTGKLRSVQYDRLGVVAIAAIQAQQKEIEVLNGGHAVVGGHACFFGLLICAD
jgi:hypothetical protein